MLNMILLKNFLPRPKIWLDSLAAAIVSQFLNSPDSNLPLTPTMQEITHTATTLSTFNSNNNLYYCNASDQLILQLCSKNTFVVLYPTVVRR